MVKIGWIDLPQSISHLGSLSVGKQPSMNEYARGITTVNSGGTFAMMNEGQTLILTIAALIGITLILNGCAEFFIRII
tara:strand:+ start:81 stop:314 length:234 start_codon:yes stop_codon:yes gene_type:complete